MAEEEDEYDDEEGDEIKDLDSVKQGMDSMTVNSAMPPTGSASKPPGMPSNQAMLQKQAEKYSPLSWTEFFDSVEKLEDRVPVYYAGT